MIIAVVAVLHIVFGGGLFTFDNVRDAAEEVIKDKDRAKQVISITKQADKGYEKYIENQDELSKEMVELNLNYHLTREEAESFFEKTKRNRAAFFDQYVSLTFQMKNLVTAEEWQAMHAKRE